MVIPNTRIMGLDFGTKKIGIAFSDRKQVFSTPHSVYHRRNMSKDLGYINNLFHQRCCSVAVIGIPEGYGLENRRWVDTILAFASKLSKKYNFIILLQDESLSTKEAYQDLPFVSRKKIESVDDKIAASCILRRVLDIMNDKNEWD